MKEKKRTDKQTTGGGSFFGSVPGLPENKNVNVSSGPYNEDLPVAGQTVGEVRRKFADRFDIGPKAQAILNGAPVKDDVVLKSGENLQFIMHAGEKGAAKVTLEGSQALVKMPEGNDQSMAIKHLAARMGPMMSTGPVILPAGIKSVLSQGNITIWVWEKPPHIAQLSWIRSDSPAPYGSSATYRKVRIALPYLIILAVFARDRYGLPQLLCKDECFFRNAPLKSLQDQLCYPALLNCSKFAPGAQSRSPLSWICTQHIKPDDRCESSVPGERFQGWFEAVRYCLLETSFNLSSEHHEANSWYGESKQRIPQIANIEKWEAETKADPTFVLEVEWLPTEHTLEGVVHRMFKLYGASGAKVESADDVARLITNS